MRANISDAPPTLSTSARGATVAGMFRCSTILLNNSTNDPRTLAGSNEPGKIVYIAHRSLGSFCISLLSSSCIRMSSFPSSRSSLYEDLLLEESLWVFRTAGEIITSVILQRNTQEDIDGVEARSQRLAALITWAMTGFSRAIPLDLAS